MFGSETFQKWRDISSSYQFITVVVATAAFTDAFIYGMILPIIPDLLQRRIGIKYSDVQLWTSVLLGIFGAFFLVTPPAVGFLTDRASSKRFPFMIGLIVMAAATLLFFMAMSLPPLLVGRALQAMSCSFCYTCGLALLTDYTPAGTRGAALGFVSLGGSIGDLSGPLLGGFIYQHAGHNAMFAISVAVIGIDIALRLLATDKQKVCSGIGHDEERLVPERRSSYGTGGIMASSAMPPVLEAVPSQERITPTKYLTPEVMSSSSGLRVLLSQSRVWATFWAMTMVAIVRTAFGSSLTIYLGEQFGWDSSIAGCVFFVFCSSAFLSPIMGHIGEKKGPRSISTLLFASMSVLLTILGLVTAPTVFSKVAFVAVIFSLGFCMAFVTAVQNITLAVIAEDIKKKGSGDVIGKAFAFTSVGWATGMLLGPLMAAVLKIRYGWEGLCFSFAILSFGSCIIMYFFAMPQEEKLDGLINALDIQA